MNRSRGVLLVAALLVGSSAAAHADPCSHPDWVEGWPASGATGVPTNAHLSAHYVASAEYLGEPVPLEHVGIGAESGSVTFDANEGLLSLVPDHPLVPSDSYKVSWPALRGLTTAALGKGADVQFTAGSADDVDTPHFTGLQSVAWDVERPTDDCTDSPDDRYWFDVGLGDADDDGGRQMLTLVVFQTAGPNLAAGSPEPVLVSRLPDSGTTVRVHRGIDAAVGHVCFAALVRDSLGRISASADREVCTTTVRPPFFYGCATSGRRARSSAPVLFAIGLAVLAWRARRSLGSSVRGAMRP